MAAGKNSISKTFVWILMGLLFVGLAGFGATSLTGTIRTVAQVGDESISVDAYVRELQREIRAVEAQTGQAMQMSQARELGLEQLALSRLTALAALDNEVGQLGLWGTRRLPIQSQGTRLDGPDRAVTSLAAFFRENQKFLSANTTYVFISRRAEQN